MADFPASKKIILLELDIGILHRVWFNRFAFVYYFLLDAVFPLIDPSFLGGVTALDIEMVGSLSADAMALRQAASLTQVQSESSTFYWDTAARGVYFHLDDHNRPALHRMVLGVVKAFANEAGQYGNTMYEGRLKSAPNLEQRRDPLFYGRLEFGGGTVQLVNDDGELDLMAEELDLFGNAARLFLGFDDEPRDQFRRLGTFAIGKVDIGHEMVSVELVDVRRYLAKRIPDKQFSVADYPNMNPDDEGKAIPIGYGVLRNIPCFCTNEKESPAPANYSFATLDTTHHGIKAIDAVRVKDVAKTPAATDLNAGTFTLAAADYSPGDEVTADIQAYKDAGGNLIANALDIIVDIIACWLSVPYSPTAYEQGAWEAAKSQAPDGCYFADDPTEIRQIAEDLAASVPGLWLPDPEGRHSFRIPNDGAYPVEIFHESTPLTTSKLSYNPEQVIGVIRVGYSPDWANGKQRKYLRDESMAAAVLERHKTVPEKTFDTFLPTEAAAQAFVARVLPTLSLQPRLFDTTRMVGNAQRRVADNIQGILQRPDGRPYFGEVKAQVIGVKYDLGTAEETLSCRLIERIGEKVYVEAGFYGEQEMYYGDDGAFYGASGEVMA